MQRHWVPSATYSHVHMSMQTFIGIPTAIMAPGGDPTTPFAFQPLHFCEPDLELHSVTQWLQSQGTLTQ